MENFSEIFIVIGHIWAPSAILLIIYAWIIARREKESLHKAIMIFLVVGGWLFLIFYLVGSRYDRPHVEELSSALLAWVIIHGTAALLALLGATVLAVARLVADDEAPGSLGSINRSHKVFGSVIAVLWMLTHAGGLINLYIFRI